MLWYSFSMSAQDFSKSFFFLKKEVVKKRELKSDTLHLCTLPGLCNHFQLHGR